MQVPSSPQQPSDSRTWQALSVEQLQALLPQYEVLEMVARGGMGAVYKARQKSLKRLVAIKVLPPEFIDDELKFSERFKHESETLAQLNHPSIVHVHDSGELGGGQLYFVMEYVDGTDVQKMIAEQGRLPMQQALTIMKAVCEALQYAHARGIIRRDIKPANVLVNREGHVKVADFGLAKMADPTQHSGLTRTHVALGTQDFAAPEMLTPGAVVDQRADVYSVGVMLYQMLTGEIPRVMFKLPSLRRPDLGARFDVLICKVLETDPADRFQSVEELHQALVEASAKSGVPAPRAQQGKFGTRLVVAAAVLIFALGGWWFLGRPQQQASSASSQQEKTLAVHTTGDAGRWIDLLDSRANPFGCKSVPGGVTTEEALHGVPVLPSGTFDGAVRVTYVIGDSGGVMITLREHRYGTGRERYVAEDSGQACRLSRNFGEAGQTKTARFSEKKMTPAEDLKKERTLEFRAVGDLLTVRLGGAEIAGYHDARLQAGPAAVVLKRGVLIKKIEYQMLDAAPKTVSEPTAILTEGGHRFQFVPGPCTWPEARKKAESMGGHLAMFYSEDRLNWMVRNFGRTVLPGGTALWLDGVKEPGAEDWKWHDGSLVSMDKGPLEFHAVAGVDPHAGGLSSYLKLGRRIALPDEAFDPVYLCEASDAPGSTSNSGDIAGFLMEWDSLDAPRGTAPLDSPRAISPLNATTPSSQAPPRHEWIKLLDTPEAIARSGIKDLEWKDGWLTVLPERLYLGRLAGGKGNAPDMAFRATVRPPTNEWPIAAVLHAGADPQYFLDVHHDCLTLRRVKQVPASKQVYTQLGNAPLDLSQAKDGAFQLEVSIQGNLITIMADGTKAMEVRDEGAARAGDIALVAPSETNGTGKIKDLAFRLLEESPVATAALGRTIDLLPLIDVSRDTIGGSWKMENGLLATSKTGGQNFIRFPVAPTGEYDLQLRLRQEPTAGATAVHFALTHAGHGANLIIDGIPNPRIGLEHIASKSMGQNAAGSLRNAPFFAPGVDYDVVIQVRDTGLVVLVDREEAFRWSGPWSDLPQQGTWFSHITDGKPVLGIAAVGVPVVVQAIELHEIKAR